MTRNLLLPCAFAAALVAGAAEDQYQTTFTGVVSVDENGVPAASGGSWTTTGVTLVNDNGKVGFETADSVMRLDVTSAAPDTNTISRIAILATIDDVGELDPPESGAQTAFAICTNSFNAWNGSEWIALSEVPSDYNGSELTNLTVEISYQRAARTARFTLGGTVLTVRSNSTEWVALSTATNNVGGFGMQGSGTLAAVSGEVMLGVAEYDGVKYGSLGSAVAAASADLTKTVSVLRETTETVSGVPDGIKIADNGKLENATITAAEGAKVNILPNEDEFKNAPLAGKSGEYTIPVKVSGGKSVEVVLPMSNKEIVGGVTRDSNNKVTFTIQTATSVLEGAKPDGTKALTHSIPNLRTYLAAHTNEAYIAADVSSSSIEAALGAPRENGLPLYQSYALGITPDTSVRPVTAPAGDADEDYITLAIPALSTSAKSGDYVVSYKVNDNAAVSDANAIKIPLETGSYVIKILFE